MGRSNTISSDGRKSHPIPDTDARILKMIAERARTLRKRKNLSSDEFSRLADINHNTYYRFERSETTGDNYTMGLVIKVIRGLDISIQEFFEEIK